MIIIVEHEAARFSCAGDGNAPSYGQDEVVLDFTLEKQLLDKWCWAAIAVSLAKFYRPVQVHQAELAGKMLGFDAADFAADDTLKERYNQTFLLYKALEAVHSYSHWSLGKPCFERLQYEINNGHPVCCRIEWYRGNAHYAVIRGYNARSREIYVEDSLHASEKIPFDRFPAHYKKAGGAWTETYWTKNQLK